MALRIKGKGERVSGCARAGALECGPARVEGAQENFKGRRMMDHGGIAFP